MADLADPDHAPRLPSVRGDGGGGRGVSAGATASRWRCATSTPIRSCWRRYSDQVPVLLVNGRKAFKYRVTAARAGAPPARRAMAPAVALPGGARRSGADRPVLAVIAASGCRDRSATLEPPERAPRYAAAPMPTIAVDAMGGDHAPEAVVQGVAAGVAADRHPVRPGRRRARVCSSSSRASAYNPEHIDIVHAAEAIGMADDPREAVRRRRDASLLGRACARWCAAAARRW